MKNKKFVSVIIPTYNEERNIEKCLKSIRSQNVPCEIIVVDQESTDDTQKVVTKYNCKLITIKKPKFYSPPSKSRNIGAKVAEGQFIFNIDADMILTKDLLKECVSIMSDNTVVGVVVPETDIANNYWAKCKKFEREFYYNTQIESARFVRKNIFLKIKGYNTIISSGEDFDIHNRISAMGRVLRSKKNILHNLNKIFFFKNLKKKYFYGKTLYRYIKHSDSKINLKTFFLIYVKKIHRIFKHPFLSVGFIFLRISESLAYTCGITFRYLK